MTTQNLGPLEQEVMSLLWEEPKTVRAVYSQIRKRKKVAYTTIMTIMTRLTLKGFLKRIFKDRAFVYSSKEPKGQIAKNVVSKIFDKLVDQFGEEAIIAFRQEVKKASKNRKL